MPDCVDTPTDSLAVLLTKQTEELSRSRWHATIRGLPHELAWRIHARLEQLQHERPLTGVYLRARCGGVKTTIIHSIVGNRKWGYSRLALRQSHTRKRRHYDPYNRALTEQSHTQGESATKRK